MTFEIFLVFLLSYTLGSIPFGLILTKFFLNKNIREIGSKNIGATNVLRTGNKFVAALTLFLDIFKGVLPILMTNYYFPDLIYLSGLLAFLGHIFPIWLKFKGGKGVATYIGFLFGINTYIGLLFIIAWLIISLITKYSSLSSLIAILVAPTYYIFINFHYDIGVFFIYLSFIIILKHLKNIKRLINKTENKIKLSK